MSYSMSTLLTRNLQDVFGENDPARRRAAIDEIWTEDGLFYDPKTGVHRGRDEIDHMAVRSRQLILTFDISQLQNPGNWATAGESNGYRPGLVRRIARDGRIAAVYLFFDELP